jgi:hypothetical protein
VKNENKASVVVVAYGLVLTAAYTKARYSHVVDFVNDFVRCPCVHLGIYCVFGRVAAV